MASRQHYWNGKPLPSGWEARQTPQGQWFFIDHANKRTQWTVPEIQPQPTSTSSHQAAASAANASSEADIAKLQKLFPTCKDNVIQSIYESVPGFDAAVEALKQMGFAQAKQATASSDADSQESSALTANQRKLVEDMAREYKVPKDIVERICKGASFNKQTIHALLRDITSSSAGQDSSSDQNNAAEREASRRQHEEEDQKRQLVDEIESRLMSGRYAAAQESVAKLLESDPNDAAALALAAETYLHSKEEHKAKSYAKSALQQDDTNERAYLVLSRAYQAHGMLTSALKYCKEGLKHCPANGTMQQLELQIEQAIRDRDEARRTSNPKKAQTKKDTAPDMFGMDFGALGPSFDHGFEHSFDTDFGSYSVTEDFGQTTTSWEEDRPTERVRPRGPNAALRRGPNKSLLRGRDGALCQGPDPALRRGPDPSNVRGSRATRIAVHSSV